MSPNLTASGLSPTYLIKSVSTYDIEGQPLAVYGFLNNLSHPERAMVFLQDFVDTNYGMTYVIFTIQDITYDENCSLNLNWDISASATPTVNDANITVYIEHSVLGWKEIHNITTVGYYDILTFQWYEYSIPETFSDYVVGEQLRIKFEVQHKLPNSQVWGQRLYINWVLLEIRRDVAVNDIQANRIIPKTPNVTIVGDISNTYNEDGVYLRVERPISPPASMGFVEFLVEYDLGLYGIESLLGIRLAHYEWYDLDIGIGGGSWTGLGKIYANTGNSNISSGYFRGEPWRYSYSIPEVRRAILPLTGDYVVNGKIQLLYNLSYDITCSSPGIVCVYLDWAMIEIIREPHPIIVSNLINTTVYAQQTVWLNISCLDGKSPITEIQINPWGEIIGNSEGTYLYSRYVDAAGTVTPSLSITDAENNIFLALLSNLTILHRPINIMMYLSENPKDQEFLIQLIIKDIFTNNPIPLHQFTKTILKNGTIFRQQAHETDLGGSFLVHEWLLDYLDWNYTVIIDANENSVYDASSVQSSIILSQCPPYIYVNGIYCNSPIKANDYITFNYTVDCQTQLASLWLCKNFTLFRPLPIALGSFNFTFQDLSGIWEYYLYANNSRGFEGYSPPFILNLSALDTTLRLDSWIDMDEHAIILDIGLFDELNRSCSNTPLRVNIFDYGILFYHQEIITGLDGANLIVHFDRYLDHSFTVQIISETTSLYNGAIFAGGGLTYDGYPLYGIIGVGLSVGVASVFLSFIRRRLRPNP